jgi:MoxR-like ATPase
MLARGASTRGAEALVRATRALARLRGRTYVIPEDVRALAVPVLAHRVVARAESGGDAGAAAVRSVLAGLAPPV